MGDTVISQVLALLGLLCILVALGALAGPWWSLLVLGAVLMLAAHTQWRAEQQPTPSNGGDR